jgi:hypothetical protein
VHPGRYLWPLADRRIKGVFQLVAERE